jgi:hypothetical protein
MTLWTNSTGDPCVKNWTDQELMRGFRKAEETGDDILYLAVMSEVERRRLKIEDSKPTQ